VAVVALEARRERAPERLAVAMALGSVSLLLAATLWLQVAQQIPAVVAVVAEVTTMTELQTSLAVMVALA